MAERLAKEGVFNEYQLYRFSVSQSQSALDSNSHGHFLGGIFVGTLGTGLTITLSNGTSGTFTVFTPTATGFYALAGTVDKGLYITLAGTGFDVTILAQDMAV